ncbi:unnamed protein product [Meganyctiphanes norvegica]|uniref:Uncharacterized protein n=1 Tax=Meganyctiphanes norvegica TaxID=48144 RepID=A0AAV2QXK8_MEGNR
MDYSKCGERCGQMVIIMLGFLLFFGGVPVLLLSITSHGEPYWIITGSLVVVFGVILITLGASGCCQSCGSEKESGLPYGHLEEEIKTEGLIPGLYYPYRPYMNQGTFEHWVDMQIGHQEKTNILGNNQNSSDNNRNESNTQANKKENPSNDLIDNQVVSNLEANPVYHQTFPV